MKFTVCDIAHHQGMCLTGLCLRLVALFFILLSTVCVVWSIQCPECDKKICPTPKDCGGGLTLDPCDCCEVCARLENQTCAGKFGLLGKCDGGLVCVIAPSVGAPITDHETGTCQVVSCHDVVCEPDPLADVVCPNDSYSLDPLVTHNGCCLRHQGCVCKADEECPKLECPEGFMSKLLAIASGTPGSCCDTYHCVNISKLVCTHQSTVRAYGETWKLDACVTCTCKGGLSFCDRTKCEVLDHCGWASVPEGQCCQVCRGCVSEGRKLYANGVTWDENSCVTCRCVDGQVYCQAQMCMVRCSNPRKIPGVCCPVCDEDDTFVTRPTDCPSTENCSLLCRHGLQTDEQGCYTCQCKSQRGACDLLCENGFKLEADGTEACECADYTPTTQAICPSLRRCFKQCDYGYRLDKNGCRKCKCNRCPAFQCRKKCAHGYVHNSKGCKLCKCTDVQTTSPIPQTPTHLPATIGRRCMSVDGRRIEDGQSWFDGCRRCFCHRGKEMCALITCPVPKCPNPIIKVGDCCPTCPDEPFTSPSLTARCQSVDGRHFSEGETWGLDECTQCICHNGGILCGVESCPPVLCHHPDKRRDRCCPICSAKDTEHFALQPGRKPGRHCTSPSGEIYSDGDTWRVNACQSCLCHDAQIHCFSQTCPIVNCNKTILKKGQCCPYCIDLPPTPPKTCKHDGSEYGPGESWLAGECSKCLCHDGEMLCSDHCDNPPTNCQSLVKIPGQCCPVCQNTTVSSVAGGVTLLPGDTLEDHQFTDDHSHPDIVEEDTDQSHRVTVSLLAAIVAVLAIVVIALIFVLMRVIRSYSYHKPKISNTTQTTFCGEVKKRPKSTNLDYQGINPLDKQELIKLLGDKTKVCTDEKVRYSVGDERLANVMPDLTHVCDTSSYRKSSHL